MTDVSKNFAIRRFATAALGADGKVGTPIVCPIACTQVAILNTDAANAQTIYSDPDDGSTTRTLATSTELTFRAFSDGGPVFQVGEVICRIAPAAGAGPVVVTFIR